MPIIAKMPLANDGRRITLLLQQFRRCYLVGIQASVLIRGDIRDIG